MKRTLLLTSLATFVVAAATPAVAAASPVQLDAFSLSTSCATPGSKISANVTVQNTTYYFQTFYAQDWVSLYGLTVDTGSPQGGYPLPPLATISQSQSAQLPSYTPYGYYTVNVGVGPSSSSPTSWSTRSSGLFVAPFC
jgi:hypothetical protein